MDFQIKTECNLCNSTDIETLVANQKHFPEFLILKCKKCGLVFLRRYLPDKKEILDDEYWGDGNINVDIYSHPEVKIEIKKRYKKYLEEAEKILNKKGELLDFGCGIGNFVRVAAEDGWDAYGIDISSQAVKYAKEQLLNVRQGKIEESGLQDNFFDIVTMWDVIEHLEDPMGTTKAVCQKLKKNGLLIIETPAEESIIRKIAWALYKISGGKIFSIQYFYYSVHRFYFSKKTITKMLEKLNMKPIRIYKEGTFLNKAKLKIQAYGSPFQKFIVAFLPLVFFLGKPFGIQNKMVILARKSHKRSCG